MAYLHADLSTALLNHLLRGVQYVPVATYHIGLLTSSSVEVSGGGYARAAIANDRNSFPDCPLDELPTKTNGVAITFPTATDTWGRITHWAIYDSAIGGTNQRLAVGSIGGSIRLVSGGATVKIPAGSLVISPAMWNGDYKDSGLGAIDNPLSKGYSDLGEGIARSLLDMVFGRVHHTPLSALYVSYGSFYTLAGQSSAYYQEYNAANYARALATFSSPINGATANVGELTLNTSSINPPYAPTHFGIHDAQTAGNLIIRGSIWAAPWVFAGDSVKFPAGECKVNLL